MNQSTPSVNKHSRAIFYAILAAALYAINAPISKLLLGQIPSTMMAGLLYLGSGIGALVLSLLIGERYFHIGYMALALLLGFVAYGLSIYFYIYAQRDLGAAKTSTYYAVSPFIGAGLSLLIFAEMPSLMFVAALAIMAVGTYLASTGEE